MYPQPIAIDHLKWLISTSDQNDKRIINLNVSVMPTGRRSSGLPLVALPPSPPPLKLNKLLLMWQWTNKTFYTRGLLQDLQWHSRGRKPKDFTQAMSYCVSAWNTPTYLSGDINHEQTNSKTSKTNQFWKTCFFPQQACLLQYCKIQEISPKKSPTAPVIHWPELRNVTDMADISV